MDLNELIREIAILRAQLAEARKAAARLPHSRWCEWWERECDCGLVALERALAEPEEKP